MVEISTVFHVCLQRDRFCSKFVVNVIIFVTGCTLQLKKRLRTLSLGFLSGRGTKHTPLVYCNEMNGSLPSAVQLTSSVEVQKYISALCTACRSEVKCWR